MHGGLSCVPKLTASLGLRNLRDQENKDLMSMVTSANDSIAFAKQVLGVSACGRALSNSSADSETSTQIENQLKALGAKVPACLLRAVSNHAKRDK